MAVKDVINKVVDKVKTAVNNVKTSASNLIQQELKTTAANNKQAAAAVTSKVGKTTPVSNNMAVGTTSKNPRASVAAPKIETPKAITTPKTNTPKTNTPKTKQDGFSLFDKTKDNKTPLKPFSITNSKDKSTEVTKPTVEKTEPVKKNETKNEVTKPNYGKGNIDLNNRPVLKNSDGTISTVDSISFNENGKEILIPTIINDNGVAKKLSDKDAIDYYHKTGEYLGKFDTIDESNAYAEQLHFNQENLYGNKKDIDSATPEEPKTYNYYYTGTFRDMGSEHDNMNSRFFDSVEDWASDVDMRVDDTVKWLQEGRYHDKESRESYANQVSSILMEAEKFADSDHLSAYKDVFVAYADYLRDLYNATCGQNEAQAGLDNPIVINYKSDLNPQGKSSAELEALLEQAKANPNTTRQQRASIENALYDAKEKEAENQELIDFYLPAMREYAFSDNPQADYYDLMNHKPADNASDNEKKYWEYAVNYLGALPEITSYYEDFEAKALNMSDEQIDRRLAELEDSAREDSEVATTADFRYTNGRESVADLRAEKKHIKQEIADINEQLGALDPFSPAYTNLSNKLSALETRLDKVKSDISGTRRGNFEADKSSTLHTVKQFNPLSFGNLASTINKYKNAINDYKNFVLEKLPSGTTLAAVELIEGADIKDVAKDVKDYATTNADDISKIDLNNLSPKDYYEYMALKGVKDQRARDAEYAVVKEQLDNAAFTAKAGHVGQTAIANAQANVDEAQKEVDRLYAELVEIKNNQGVGSVYNAKKAEFDSAEEVLSAANDMLVAMSAFRVYDIDEDPYFNTKCNEGSVRLDTTFNNPESQQQVLALIRQGKFTEYAISQGWAKDEIEANRIVQLFKGTKSKESMFNFQGDGPSEDPSLFKQMSWDAMLPNDNWDAERIQNFNYLVAEDGFASAFSYAVAVNSELNTSAREANELQRGTQILRQMKYNKTVGMTNAIMLPVAGSAMSAVASVGDVVDIARQNINNVEYTNSSLSFAQQYNQELGLYSQALDMTMSGIPETFNIGDTEFKIPVIGGKSPSFFYQAYASAVQSAELMAMAAGVTKVIGAMAPSIYTTEMTNVAGSIMNGARETQSVAAGITKGLTNAAFFSSVFASTYDELKGQGMSNEQILLTATLHGINEALFEQFSIENLYEAGFATSLKETIGQVLISNAIEGSEEVCTDWANTLADSISAALTDGKSELNRNILDYTAQGYSKNEATTLALKDWSNQLSDSFVAGMISSAFSTGARAVSTYTKASITGHAYNASTNFATNLAEFVQDIPEDRKASWSVENRQQAEKLAESIAKKGKAEDAEIGALMSIIRSEDATAYEDFAFANAATVAEVGDIVTIKNAIDRKAEALGITGIQADFQNEDRTTVSELGAELIRDANVDPDSALVIQSIVADVVSGSLNYSNEDIVDELTEGSLSDENVQRVVYSFIAHKVVENPESNLAMALGELPAGNNDVYDNLRDVLVNSHDNMATANVQVNRAKTLMATGMAIRQAPAQAVAKAADTLTQTTEAPTEKKPTPIHKKGSSATYIPTFSNGGRIESPNDAYRLTDASEWQYRKDATDNDKFNQMMDSVGDTTMGTPTNVKYGAGLTSRATNDTIEETAQEEPTNGQAENTDRRTDNGASERNSEKGQVRSEIDTGRQGEGNTRQANLLSGSLTKRARYLVKSLRNKLENLSKRGELYVPNTGLKVTDEETFAQALNLAIEASPIWGNCVDAHTAEELKAMGARCFLSENGFTGMAVTEDGNIISVFNSENEANENRRAIGDLILTAISNGGNHLDCFMVDQDRNLVNFYAQYGFKPVAWMDFNADIWSEDHEGKTWPEELGNPHVVFMARDVNTSSEAVNYALRNQDNWTWERIENEVQKFDDYDAAVAKQLAVTNFALEADYSIDADMMSQDFGNSTEENVENTEAGQTGDNNSTSQNVENTESAQKESKKSTKKNVEKKPTAKQKKRLAELENEIKLRTAALAEAEFSVYAAGDAPLEQQLKAEEKRNKARAELARAKSEYEKLLEETNGREDSSNQGATGSTQSPVHEGRIPKSGRGSGNNSFGARHAVGDAQLKEQLKSVIERDGGTLKEDAVVLSLDEVRSLEGSDIILDMARKAGISDIYFTEFGNVLSPAGDELRGFTTQIPEGRVMRSILCVTLNDGEITWNTISGFEHELIHHYFANIPGFLAKVYIDAALNYVFIDSALKDSALEGMKSMDGYRKAYLPANYDTLTGEEKVTADMDFDLAMKEELLAFINGGEPIPNVPTDQLIVLKTALQNWLNMPLNTGRSLVDTVDMRWNSRNAGGMNNFISRMAYDLGDAFTKGTPTYEALQQIYNENNISPMFELPRWNRFVEDNPNIANIIALDISALSDEDVISIYNRQFNTDYEMSSSIGDYMDFLVSTRDWLVNTTNRSDWAYDRTRVANQILDLTEGIEDFDPITFVSTYNEINKLRNSLGGVVFEESADKAFFGTMDAVITSHTDRVNPVFSDILGGKAMADLRNEIQTEQDKLIAKADEQNKRNYFTSKHAPFDLDKAERIGISLNNKAIEWGALTDEAGEAMRLFPTGEYTQNGAKIFSSMQTSNNGGYSGAWWGKMERPLVLDTENDGGITSAYIKTPQNLRAKGSKAFTGLADLIDLAEAKGYDGIIEGDNYVFFNASQLAPADYVVYDAQGFELGDERFNGAVPQSLDQASNKYLVDLFNSLDRYADVEERQNIMANYAARLGYNKVGKLSTQSRRRRVLEEEVVSEGKPREETEYVWRDRYDRYEVIYLDEGSGDSVYYYEPKNTKHYTNNDGREYVIGGDVQFIRDATDSYEPLYPQNRVKYDLGPSINANLPNEFEKWFKAIEAKYPNFNPYEFEVDSDQLIRQVFEIGTIGDKIQGWGTKYGERKLYIWGKDLFTHVWGTSLWSRDKINPDGTYAHHAGDEMSNGTGHRNLIDASLGQKIYNTFKNPVFIMYNEDVSRGNRYVPSGTQENFVFISDEMDPSGTGPLMFAVRASNGYIEIDGERRTGLDDVVFTGYEKLNNGQVKNKHKELGILFEALRNDKNDAILYADKARVGEFLRKYTPYQTGIIYEIENNLLGKVGNIKYNGYNGPTSVDSFEAIGKSSLLSAVDLCENEALIFNGKKQALAFLSGKSLREVLTDPKQLNAGLKTLRQYTNTRGNKNGGNYFFTTVPHIIGVGYNEGNEARIIGMTCYEHSAPTKFDPENGYGNSSVLFEDIYLANKHLGIPMGTMKSFTVPKAAPLTMQSIGEELSKIRGEKVKDLIDEITNTMDSLVLANQDTVNVDKFRAYFDNLNGIAAQFSDINLQTVYDSIVMAQLQLEDMDNVNQDLLNLINQEVEAFGPLVEKYKGLPSPMRFDLYDATDEYMPRTYSVAADYVRQFFGKNPMAKSEVIPFLTRDHARQYGIRKDEIIFTNVEDWLDGLEQDVVTRDELAKFFDSDSYDYYVVRADEKPKALNQDYFDLKSTLENDLAGEIEALKSEGDKIFKGISVQGVGDSFGDAVDRIVSKEDWYGFSYAITSFIKRELADSINKKDIELSDIFDTTGTNQSLTGIDFLLEDICRRIEKDSIYAYIANERKFPDIQDMQDGIDKALQGKENAFNISNLTNLGLIFEYARVKYNRDLLINYLSQRILTDVLRNGSYLETLEKYSSLFKTGVNIQRTAQSIKKFGEAPMPNWRGYVLDGAIEGTYDNILIKDRGMDYTNHNMRQHWNEGDMQEGKNVIVHARTNEWIDGLSGKRVKHIEEIQSDLHNEGLKRGYRMKETNSETLPPLTPFAKTYTELALRSIIYNAIKNGISRITWTTAQQQGERWSDNYIKGYENEYGRIGSELTSGDIPKYLQKLVKHFGGEIGWTVIGENNDLQRARLLNANNEDTISDFKRFQEQSLENSWSGSEKNETAHVVPYFDISDKLADAVIAGKAFTRYDLSGIDNNGKALSGEQIDYFKNSVMKDENGELIRLYHGTHTWGRQQIDNPSPVSYYLSTNPLIAQTYSGSEQMLSFFDENVYDSTFDAENLSLEDKIELYAERSLNARDKVWSYETTDDGKVVYTIERSQTASNNPKPIIREVPVSLIEEYTKVKGAVKQGVGNAVYYANLVNPIIIDADYASYDDILIENLPKEIQDNIPLDFVGYTISTDRIVEIIDELRVQNKLPYDGIIIKNVLDDGLYYEEMYKQNPRADFYGDDVIVFNSNSLKDINNTRPTTSPNFRYDLGADMRTFTDANPDQFVILGGNLVSLGALYKQAFDGRISDWVNVEDKAYDKYRMGYPGKEHANIPLRAEASLRKLAIDFNHGLYMDDSVESILNTLHANDGIKIAERKLATLKTQFHDSLESSAIPVGGDGFGETLSELTADRLNQRQASALEVARRWGYAKANGNNYTFPNKDGNPNDFGTDKLVFFVTGLAAAGKSSVIANPLSNTFKAAIPDSDEFKKLLKEFDNGWGASIVHEESSRINNAYLADCIDHGYNIVLPIVGGNYDKLVSRAQMFKDNGYRVIVCYNDVRNQESVSRALIRYINDNRYLPVDMLVNNGHKPLDAFLQIMDDVEHGSDVFDGYLWKSNETKLGTPTPTIAASASYQKLLDEFKVEGYNISNLETEMNEYQSRIKFDLGNPVIDNTADEYGNTGVYEGKPFYMGTFDPRTGRIIDTATEEDMYMMPSLADSSTCDFYVSRGLLYVSGGHILSDEEIYDLGEIPYDLAEKLTTPQGAPVIWNYNRHMMYSIDGQTGEEIFGENNLNARIFDAIHENGDVAGLEYWINEQLNKNAETANIYSIDIPTYLPLNDRQREALENLKQELIEKYGKKKQGMKAANKTPMPKKQNNGENIRTHGVRIVETGGEQTPEYVAEEFMREILTDEAFTYSVSTDAKAIASAENLYNSYMSRYGDAGFDKLIEDRWNPLVAADARITKSDIAIGEKILIEASHNNRMDIAMRVGADLCVLGTELGQAVQALSLLKKMTPQGQMYYLTKVVARLNRRYQKEIDSGKISWITISDDDAYAVYSAQTREELDAAVDVLKKHIADQLPVSWIERWNAWRYLSMLGNARTHIRNLVGNGGFSPFILMKNITAAIGESIFVDKSIRTKSLSEIFKNKKNSAYKAFADADFENVVDIITGNGKYNTTSELMNLRDIWSKGWLNKVTKGQFGKAMNFLEEANSEGLGRAIYNSTEGKFGTKNDIFGLESGDVVFLRAYYTNALAGFLAARGLDASKLDTLNGENRKLLNEARAYAIKEAQRATYRDASAIANALNRLKRVDGLGIFVEGLVPFTKTPINILARGAKDYSPYSIVKGGIEFARGLSQYKNNPNSEVAKQAVTEGLDRLCSGMTGTMVMVVGAALAAAGLLRGSGGDDDDDFEALQGHQDYAIEIGGVSYTIDWLAPIALPLFVGCEMYKGFSRGNNLSGWEMADALVKIVNPMTSLSMLDGVNNALSTVAYSDTDTAFFMVLESMLESYAAQAIPTISGQVARTLDPDRRSNYTDLNKPAPNWMQRFVQKSIMGKIPVLEEQRQAYVDEWGRKVTKSSLALRAFENFLSPGYIRLIDSTQADEEIARLYKETGNKDVLPNRAYKYFNVDENGDGQAERKDLTADEYEKLQTIRGQTAYALVTSIINSEYYGNLTPDEQVEAIHNAYDYASEIAKNTLSPSYKVTNWVNIASEIGPANYVLLKTNISDADTNAELFDLALTASGLSNDQRALLIATRYQKPEDVVDRTDNIYTYKLSKEARERSEEIYKEECKKLFNVATETTVWKNATSDERLELLDEVRIAASEATQERLSKELLEDDMGSERTLRKATAIKSKAGGLSKVYEIALTTDMTTNEQAEYIISSFGGSTSRDKIDFTPDMKAYQKTLYAPLFTEGYVKLINTPSFQKKNLDGKLESISKLHKEILKKTAIEVVKAYKADTIPKASSTQLSEILANQYVEE